jgi:hypothetical protein
LTVIINSAASEENARKPRVQWKSSLHQSPNRPLTTPENLGANPGETLSALGAPQTRDADGSAEAGILLLQTAAVGSLAQKSLCSEAGLPCNARKCCWFRLGPANTQIV